MNELHLISAAKSTVMLLTILVASSIASANIGGQDELQRIYHPQKGYSVCMPDGAIDINPDNTKWCAYWKAVTENGKDTLWSIRFSMAPAPENGNEGLNPSATEMLTKKLNMTVEYSKLVLVKKKRAIMLTGSHDVKGNPGSIDWKKPVKLYARKLWILVSSDKLLVIEYSCLNSKKELCQAVWNKILKSLQWIDPKASKQEYTENIERALTFIWGKKRENTVLLKPRLTAERIRASMPITPVWFLIHKNGINSGWMCMSGDSVRVDGNIGYELKTWTVLTSGENKPVFSRSSVFLNTKLDYERWRETIRTGSGEKAQIIDIKGLRQKDAIVVSLRKNITDRVTHQTRIPERLLSVFLPGMAKTCFNNMVDLSRLESYVFAVYSPFENKFNMHTFEVRNKELVQFVDGRKMEATIILSRSSPDSLAAIRWVDNNGKILKIKTTAGLEMERVERSFILKSFSNVEKIIAEMNRVFDTLILPIPNLKIKVL